MKQKYTVSPRHEQLLCFARLPQKMLALSFSDNLVEFVLHELCSPRCFNITKAAYFIDNADFNCLKGVAGFDKINEFEDGTHDSWNAPEKFTQHMNLCQFNTHTRSVVLPSPTRAQQSTTDLVSLLAHMLDIRQPQYYTWMLKHDNRGILIYQVPESHSGHGDTTDTQEPFDAELLCGLHILAFCPVY
jgi:hypothetical protein